MNIINKIINRIKKVVYRLLSDEKFIKQTYKEKFGRDINLIEPKEFNEKLQWLKLYDRRDIYTTMIDKYEAKEFVGNIIGNEYIIKTLGIYDKFDEIDFSSLPNEFVMKTTHDSGGVIVCKNKQELNIKKARRMINKSLKTNYYNNFREYPYKNVKPRIIIEEYIEDETTKKLRDYKIYAFNGEADYLMLCVDRFINNVKFLYFDRNWNIIKEFSNDGMKYGDTIKVEKPKNLDKMFEFAKLLSKDIPFVRVDFYEANGKLYFGELTFFPSAGFDNTRTDEIRKYLDEKLILPTK